MILSSAAHIKAETSNLFPERRTESYCGRELEMKGGRSNSPMWMIESESADFHSWLKKMAKSNIAQITFMLSRDISPQNQINHSSLRESDRT